MNDFIEVAEAIKNSRSPVLCGHVMPDGDSLGSLLALGLGLKSMGKEVTMVSSDPIPELYNFLPGVENIHVGNVPTGNYDMLIVVDCSVPERLGDTVLPLVDTVSTVVIIDHHVNESPFGQYNYINSRVAATGELIMDFLDYLKVKLNQDIATNLYTAIVTDSGSFRYENTTPETHQKASRLVECGVSVARLSNLIFGEQPIESLRLLQAALNTLEVCECGKIAWMSMTMEKIQEIGATDQHLEGLINYPRKVKGVELAIMFREMVGGKVKVSFRSKYQVDVNRLARVFGGGGHVRASGCTVEGELSQVQAMVLAEAKKLFRGC
ncbi:DHH family phosphoesterase [Desulfotomaculum nigrificans]|uniref:DHH family phosphoesterase n=1 Tax=Desulfotomaculum nigrificans TaxID=1565 RepID=UPI0001FAF0C1|nr:bifunctional oligoribonuclease/PAP phosphatase NrnA [Desulfotomaculum nigrificans]